MRGAGVQREVSLRQNIKQIQGASLLAARATEEEQEVAATPSRQYEADEVSQKADMYEDNGRKKNFIQTRSP